MNLIGSRVKEARLAKRMSQQELARRVGVSQGAIAQQEKSVTAKSKFLPEIAKIVGVSIDWLLFGVSVPAQPKAEQTRAAYGNFEIVPLLNNTLGAGAQALLPFDLVDGGVQVPVAMLKASNAKAKHLRAARVRGDSMYPYASDGDVVLVNTVDRDIVNGEVYALRDDDNAMLKRLYKQIDGRVRVESDNKNYPPDYLTPDREGVIIGRVIWRGG